MSSSVVVDISEMMTLAAQMQGAAPIVADEFAVAMNRATIVIQSDARSNIRQEGAIDTGRLLNSIVRRVEPFEGEVGTNVDYARPVEDGRRPGAPMPPSGVLLGWMARHDIPLEAEFALRRSIARRGIRARPYLIPALEQNRDTIDREFSAASSRIVKRLVA